MVAIGPVRRNLAFAAANAEALALKRQAEGNLKPKDPTLGNALGMTFAKVDPGCFQMGSNDGASDEMPVRTVRLTNPYWMGKCEVTQKEYAQLTGCNPSRFKGEELPVEMVNWEDATKFCEELTRQERAAGRLPVGYVYRLPTEAEWEYAARGGAKSRCFVYSGGDDLGAVAWFRDNSGNAPHPVGAMQANELGLHDMSGNVWEWCLDWYKESYDGLGSTDPAGPSSGLGRVDRGGSCFSAASLCLSVNRGRLGPSIKDDKLGFRVVLAPVP